MERLLILLDERYAKTILYAFCEYDRRTIFLDGQTVWLMLADHFIDRVNIREVAAKNNLAITTCWEVLQWAKAKFKRHKLWIPELGFPPEKSASALESANCQSSNA